MTDAKESNSIANSAKSYAKTAWTWIKWLWATSTSLISDILKIVWPQWLRAETMWKAWTWTKRGMAVGILAVGGLLAWKFSVDITRLSIGSFRAASTFGRNLEVTKNDLKSMRDELTAKLAAIAKKQEAADAMIDQLISESQSRRDATISLPAKKTYRKSPAKKSSFSVPDLSKYLP